VWALSPRLGANDLRGFGNDSRPDSFPEIHRNTVNLKNGIVHPNTCHVNY